METSSVQTHINTTKLTGPANTVMPGLTSVAAVTANPLMYDLRSSGCLIATVPAFKLITLAKVSPRLPIQQLAAQRSSKSCCDLQLDHRLLQAFFLAELSLAEIHSVYNAGAPPSLTPPPVVARALAHQVQQQQQEHQLPLQ
jgi:hypothetical protein